MTIWRAKAAVAGAMGLSLAALGYPALSQDRPESLLPPGFSDPVPPDPQPNRPAEGTPQPQASRTAAPMVQPLPGVPGPGGPAPSSSPTPSPTPTATPTPVDPALLAEYELPSYARRPLDFIGVAGVEGVAPDAWGGADGAFLEVLMRRLNAPIASRWLSIALRRTLMATTETPRNVNGADWAAERAWLLIRMGESVAARAVVQSVDIENYTHKMLQIAMQAALATGDPAAMCGYVGNGQATLAEGGWVLAAAICDGLKGEPRAATRLIDQRRRRMGNSIDLLLAEKVVGAGSSGRRAVTIEWDTIEQLTAWRYGLAAATGVEIPDRLLSTVGPQVTCWRALSPVLAASVRAGAAEQAAARGVISNAALVDLYGIVEQDADDAAATPLGVARDLRDAYVANGAGARMAAMRRLWDEPTNGMARHARQVLTARAAAAITPDPALAADAGRLIGSMLTAGLDLPALRWAPAVARGSLGWALLATANPSPRGGVSARDVRDFAGQNESAGRMLAAGLAGLGRIDAGLAEEVGVDLTPNRWSRALAFAASRNQPGTVLLLSAVGMQSNGWAGVPPGVLYHVTAALRQVGMEGEARMIAAEAVSRL